MDKQIQKTELQCTAEDLDKMEGMKCKAKSELRFAGIFILVISVVLPFLPPKYSGTKSMLDIMSYPTAAAGIVTVLGVVFLWSIYYMLYGLSKDLKYKTKISVQTYVISVGIGSYKWSKYNYFSAAGLPLSLGRLILSADKSGLLKKGDRVIVEYSKYGKKLLGWKKVQ